MKAKKSRVILSGVSLLLVLCLLVGGTMAWFTDTEKVDTNFTAGILDVSVKPGEEGKTALDFKNLRPMLYENFYNELDKNEWNNDVTQGGTTGLKDSHYAPVPAYFKPVDITNEGTLPTKVKLSLEAGDGCEAGEPILTEDNITIKQDPEKVQDCENRLAPVLKVFVYKLVGDTWTRMEGVNLNTAYDEAVANPDGVASENTAKEAKHTYMTAMIPAGGTARYVIAGYLPETVGNAYQGQHYHGKLVLNAYQMDDTEAGNPDEGGSGTEDPDDPERFKDNVTIEWHENTLGGAQVGSPKVITVKSDTTIAATDHPAPEGYMYSPDAAEQFTAVTVDDETGKATPATVVFTVVPVGSGEEPTDPNPDFAGGDGSEEDPFLIMNAEQFNKIRNYSDKHFILGANIELGEYVPTPSLSGSLNGEYQGVKYTVSYTISGGDNLGLFVSNAGTLKNLTITDDSAINTTGNNCGTIAAINSGTIENCVSHATINGGLEAALENEGKNSNFGGIVSQNTAGAVIRNTTFQGKINPNLSDVDLTMAMYPFIAMYQNNAGLAVSNSGTIENCTVAAPADDANVRGAEYNAGLVVQNMGTITGTKTTGTVLSVLTPTNDPDNLEFSHSSLTVCSNEGTYIPA